MSATDLRAAQPLATRCWVIKIGSALITNDGLAVDTQRLAQWAEQMVALRAQGTQVVLVSSGAVAAGMVELGWTSRPAELPLLQAAAAVGQNRLMSYYHASFAPHAVNTAQMLLTHADLADRQRYLNARSTLRALLKHDVLPIINENDSVVTDEIRFGDNDTLAALVANLVEADALVILTDQEGLYDADPRHNPSAQLIPSAQADDPRLAEVATEGGALGRGGMVTKVRAAQLAARSGARTVIASGRSEQVLTQLREGAAVGTHLFPNAPPLLARKQWLAGQLHMKGWVCIDAGAAKAIREQGKSLLPVGVTEVGGQFHRGELIECRDSNQQVIARGLTNYSSQDIAQIKGCSSALIAERLGYISEPELIHRDNLVAF
jgi:glutamate 5-kinase